MFYGIDIHAICWRFNKLRARWCLIHLAAHALLRWQKGVMKMRLRVNEFSRMPTINLINAEVGIHMSYNDRHYSGSGYTTAATYLQ
nr:hypothetical protein [Tanacetum cinerariifolium]